MKKKSESGEYSVSTLFVFKLLITMKLTLILICSIGLLSSFGKSHAQNTKLSVEFKKSSIEDVLNFIESNTECTFMYDRITSYNVCYTKLLRPTNTVSASC